jgi:hypothetical protein
MVVISNIKIVLNVVLSFILSTIMVKTIQPKS